MRIASCICVIISLSLLVFFAFDYKANCCSEPERLGLVVRERELEMGEMSVGRHKIAFRIDNVSASPLRIIGNIPSCGLRACLSPIVDAQVSIPAKNSIDFECQVDIRSPGEFTCQCEIFLEDGGIRTVKLGVRGIGVAPEGPPRASEKP